MPFLRLLILFYKCPKTGLHASKVKKKHLKNVHLISKWFLLNDLFEESVSLNPSFHCCDWSDGSVLCDWSTKYSANDSHANIMQMCYFMTYSPNRIRFKFLTTRSGDWEPTLFFYIDNNFIYRALSASKLCRKIVFTYFYMTHCMKGNILKRHNRGTFTNILLVPCLHLADAFIQSDLHATSDLFRLYMFLSVCVFPGNRTNNLYAANAML